MTPKISVIVPVYKVEKYLDRCILSIKNQTLANIEVILVDDGSPDSCPALCDNYVVKDARFKVIHKDNEGLGIARNAGLDVATGDYVAFVDSDDYIDLSMFEILYNKAIEQNCDAVYCNTKYEFKPNKWKNISNVYQEQIWEGNNINSFLLGMISSEPNVSQERQYQMSVWHSIYKRSVIEENNIRFMSERKIVSEDLPFQVDFLLRSKKIICIPDYLYYYCLNASSLTHSFSPQKYTKYKILYSYLSKKLEFVGEATYRLDRFFIGNVRVLLIQVFQYKWNNKHEFLNEVLNDPIWSDIKNRFPVKSLPLHASIMLKIIFSKSRLLLEIYTRILIQLKQLLH